MTQFPTLLIYPLVLLTKQTIQSSRVLTSDIHLPVQPLSLPVFHKWTLLLDKMDNGVVTLKQKLHRKQNAQSVFLSICATLGKFASNQVFPLTLCTITVTLKFALHSVFHSEDLW